MRIEDVEQSGNTVELPAQRENDSPIEGDGDEDFEIPSVAEYRASVDAVYRDYAIEQGCARVREIEENTISPAMRRIEAEDPSRQLVGFEHRLKSEERLAEKVDQQIGSQPGLTYEDAFASVKDAIRYTFQYSDDRYAEGLETDRERLESAGFELVELRNTWDSDEYKGINSRWREPETSQVFEVQFHTQTSFETKQLTHSAYEKIRDPDTPPAERDELKNFQREATGRLHVPPGAADIPNYP